MGATVYNCEYWPMLVKVLHQAKANQKQRPVLWVGAGLSVPAGYPTTAALINTLNDKAPQQILPFTPDDTTLGLDHFQRSFSQLIKTNTHGYLIGQLADIFVNNSERLLY